MNNLISLSHQRFLPRKAVPDGSFHFQRVLNKILLNDKCGDNVQVECAIDDRAKEEELSNYYEDDFAVDPDPRFCDQDRLPNIHGVTATVIGAENKSNKKDSNNNDYSSVCSCALDECHQGNIFDQGDSDVISPTGVVIVDFFGNSVTYKVPEGNSKKSSLLPKISSWKSQMGANCSSNIYDRRDWHNVGDAGCSDMNKLGKRGRLMKKRPQEIMDNAQALPDICTCQHQQQEAEDAKGKKSSISSLFRSGNIFKGSSEKRSFLSPNDTPETSEASFTSNRLSPTVDSSGHVKISRVVGSGRARATSSCDVSPHRLLTRRVNSPNGRAGSFEALLASSPHDTLRQRSHSWSNGKLGSKTNYKSLNSSNRPLLGAAASHKGIYSQSTANGSKTLACKALKTALSPATSLCQSPLKLTAIKAHDPSCPMYNKLDGMRKMSDPKTSSLAHEEDDEDFTPMTRRRAASESQTTRPRRLLPRTPDSPGSQQDHAHVHWADEEKGCSLSTCVFLTSIRPRSYSHGAMDSIPHRPILKKVTGF